MCLPIEECKFYFEINHAQEQQSFSKYKMNETDMLLN